MKKYIAAAGAIVALAAGAVGTRQAVSGGSECTKPLTLFDSEQSASIAALEDYIEQNVASTFKHPAELQWGSDDFSPVLQPGKIAARIMLIEGASVSPERYYHVTLVRDCAGGEWEVVEFKAVKP